MSTLSTENPSCPFQRCDAAADPEVIGSGWDFEYESTRDELAIGRCRRCGLVYPTRLPVAAEMHRIYPSSYLAYSGATKTPQIVQWVRGKVERRKAANLERLVERSDARVLDIGCADGRLLEILRRSCPVGWHYSGIEIGDEAAQRAAAKGFEVRSGDLESLDLSDWKDSFDLVLMHQVIEHTRHPDRTLQKIRELLRPGGVVSIETPDVDAWDFNLFRSRYWGGYHIPRHFFLFNKKNFCELARSNGFEVVSARSILSPSFWIITLHNRIADHERLRPLRRYIKVRNPVLLALTTMIEVVQVRLFRQSSNMQIILRRADPASS